MTPFKRTLLLARLGALLAAAAASAAMAAPVYHIEMIPIQNGYTPTRAYAVNNHGVVVGVADSANGIPCYTYAAGVLTILPDSSIGHCTSINDAGDVVGSVLIDGDYKPAYWPAGGARVMLPMVSAHGINNQGQIAGVAAFNGAHHAAIWDHGVLTDLGTMGGDKSGAAYLNSDGKVVGASQDADGIRRQAAWENGNWQQVCQYKGANNRQAAGVNEGGQILCWATFEAGQGQIAFIQDAEGNHVIPGYKDFVMLAYDLNDNADVVGMVAAPQQAFFSNGKKTFKLESLVDNIGKWTSLHAAFGINNAGQIVGDGKQGHKDLAFIATPVAR